MPKFKVISVMTADTAQDVEAADAHEAVEKADISTPSLCHHCSGRVAIGDPYKVEVIDEAGELVEGAGWDDSPFK